MVPRPVVPSDPNLNQEGDEVVREFFSEDDLKMSPEEFAARHAHEWGCFGLHRLRFRDAALASWVQRFAEIAASNEELEQCRQRFLSTKELAMVHKKESEEF